MNSTIQSTPQSKTQSTPQSTLAVSAGATCRCPVCGCTVDHNPVVCSRCDTPHHEDCWGYAGGCAIFGCRVSERQVSRSLSESQTLAENFREWSRLYYLQWSAVAAMGLGQCVHSISNALSWILAWDVGMGLRPVSYCLTFLSLSGLFGLLALVGLLVYLYLIIPARRQQTALEHTLNTSLAPPRTKGMAIGANLTLSSRKRLLLTLLSSLRPLAVVCCGLAVVALVAAPLGNVASWMGLTEYHVFELLISAFLVGAGLIACRTRLIHFETLENRLMASVAHAKQLAGKVVSSTVPRARRPSQSGAEVQVTM